MDAPEVFISYSWKDKANVEEIDKALRLAGVTVRRDIRDIEYRESIKAFMKRIRHCDFALIVVTDNYLRSKNCMYEILEFVKDDAFEHRILPIVLDSAVYTRKYEYVEYWEHELKSLRARVAALDLKNVASLSNDLRVLDNISSTIGEFIAVIQDMNCPPYDTLKQQGFKTLLLALKLSGYDVTVQLMDMYFTLERSQLRSEAQQFLSSHPDNIVAMHILGELHNRDGRYDDAIEVYSHILEKGSGNAGAYNGRGYAYYMKNELDKALPDLTEAIRLEPAFAAPHLHLGNIYFANNSKDEALQLYSEAISLEPDEALHFYARANCCRDLGRQDDALKDYDEAIRLNPRYEECYCNRGELYLRMGRYECAEKDFIVAKDLDPKDDAPVFNLALALYRQQKHADAIESMTVFLGMVPEDATGYFIRALAKIDRLAEKRNKLFNLSRPEDIAGVFDDISGAYRDLRKAASLGNSAAAEALDGLSEEFRHRPFVG